MASLEQAMLMVQGVPAPVPPASCETNEWYDNVVLRLHGDSFIDTSQYAHVMTPRGSIAVDPVITVFPGEASLNIAAIPDSLSTPYIAGPGTEWDVGTGPVSWDFWVRPQSFDPSLLQAVMSTAANISGPYEWCLFFTSNYITLYIGYRGSIQGNYRFFFATPLVISQWDYVALERNAIGEWRCYVNGVPGTQYQIWPIGGGGFGSVQTGIFVDTFPFSGFLNTHLTVGIFGYGGGAFDFGCTYANIQELTYTIGYARDAFPVPGLPWCNSILPSGSISKAKSLTGQALVLTRGVLSAAVSLSNPGLVGKRINLSAGVLSNSASDTAKNLIGRQILLSRGSIAARPYERLVLSNLVLNTNTTSFAQCIFDGTGAILFEPPPEGFDYMGAWGLKNPGNPTDTQPGVGAFYEIKIDDVFNTNQGGIVAADGLWHTITATGFQVYLPAPTLSFKFRASFRSIDYGDLGSVEWMINLITSDS